MNYMYGQEIAEAIHEWDFCRLVGKALREARFVICDDEHLERWGLRFFHALHSNGLDVCVRE